MRNSVNLMVYLHDYVDQKREYPYTMADPFEDILMANERFLLC